ncbi:hypothetical protein [Streptomyces sp. NPDC055140]
MNLDDMLGPEYARVIRARKELETAITAVVETAQSVQDFGPMGTDELPAAVSALEASEHVDSDEGAAQWVSRAFTATPVDLLKTGETGLAFGGSVALMRAALHDLDQALAALDDEPGPTASGGTFSR